MDMIIRIVYFCSGDSSFLSMETPSPPQKKTKKTQTKHTHTQNMTYYFTLTPSNDTITLTNALLVCYVWKPHRNICCDKCFE